MIRMLNINGIDIKLKPSANFLYYYRNARLSGEPVRDFQQDLQSFTGLDKLQEQFGNVGEENALDILQASAIFDFSINIRRMLWTFAFCADRSILPFEAWCDALEEYDLVETAKVVMELVNENFFLMLGVKAPRVGAR